MAGKQTSKLDGRTLIKSYFYAQNIIMETIYILRYILDYNIVGTLFIDVCGVCNVPPFLHSLSQRICIIQFAFVKL